MRCCHQVDLRPAAVRGMRVVCRRPVTYSNTIPTYYVVYISPLPKCSHGRAIFVGFCQRVHTGVFVRLKFRECLHIVLRTTSQIGHGVCVLGSALACPSRALPKRATHTDAYKHIGTRKHPDRVWYPMWRWPMPLQLVHTTCIAFFAIGTVVRASLFVLVVEIQLTVLSEVKRERRQRCVLAVICTTASMQRA